MSPSASGRCATPAALCVWPTAGARWTLPRRAAPRIHDEWIVAERGRLRELFLTAAHDLVLLLREAGDLPAAISVAYSAVREDPLAEAATRDLMELHFAAREPHRALRAFHELELNLNREIGERASAVTRELARGISSGNCADGAAQEDHGAPGTSTQVVVQLVCALSRLHRWAPALAGARDHIKRRLIELVRGAQTSDASDGSAHRSGQVYVDEPLRIAATFADPSTGIDCAVELRADLARFSWPNGEEMDTCIALDTWLKPHPPDCAGRSLSSALRRGEIVLSEATAALVRRSLKPGLLVSELRDSRLAGTSEHLYRIECAGAARSAAVP